MKLKKIISIVLLQLVFFCNALAQKNILKSIEEQFTYDKQSISSEKIFVHTDKNFYLAGEIMWFKLYNVDENSNQPNNLSKVAYVDVIDKDQRSVLQCKIALNEGTGDGSLYLPVSLTSGAYKLRAYTNWMKNFDADFYFEKPITIVNTLKTFESPNAPIHDYDIQFFPEGGNLVQGLESKVAFRVVDQSGKGLNCRTAIVNLNNDTIVQSQSLKFGIGHFSFTPKAGEKYTAIIHLADTTIMRSLPEIFSSGYVMMVNNISPSQLKISIQTNILSTNTIYLFAHTHQMIKLKEQGAVINGKAEFIIDKNKLGEGISHFTVFNKEKQPLCERLYFIQPVQKLIVQSTPDNQQYNTRKKVNLSVITMDELGKPTSANMSVSVYKMEPFQADENNISNYFWLTSDLKGTIESPGYYFSAKGPEADEAIDNLMLTHGWRRFTWTNPQASNPTYSFLPEWKGHIITGKIIDTRNGLPAANKVVYLSVPGSRIQLYGGESDADGNVRFYTKDFYGSNEIVLQTDARTDTTYRIEISNPFSTKFSSKPFPYFELPEQGEDPMIEESVAVQVQNTFSSDKLKHFFAHEVDSNAFFGKPDVQYMLDDYTRFSTMEEVLREYVYEVLVRRQKENFRLIMADGANRIFMDDPFTLFNGVPVFETSRIMQYDPLKVKKIEVLKRKYFYGPLIFNGVVNFTTYYPEPAMVSDTHSLVIDYEGLQYHREFYSPVYETEEQLSSRLPDFRNVLYWSPNIKTDATGKSEISFYTSDKKGKYNVVLQGMNSNGKIGEQFFSFEVK